MSKLRATLVECLSVLASGILASLYVTFAIEYQITAQAHDESPQYLDPAGSIHFYLLFGLFVGFTIGFASAFLLLLWMHLFAYRWPRAFVVKLIEQVIAALLPILIAWFVLYMLSGRAPALHLIPLLLIVLVASVAGALLSGRGRPADSVEA